MYSLDQIREKLKDHNLSAVAKSCGISYMSAYRAVRVNSSNVSYSVVKALSDYLEQSSK